MLNEFFICQVLTILILGTYLKLINILSLWYAAGLYLILLGLNLLIKDGDIFVGFLWVVDLGVGLIFFIFILHFSNFLHQKAHLDTFKNSTTNYLNFLIFAVVLLYFLNITTTNPNLVNYNNWIFTLSWYNYYTIYNVFSSTSLQLLRELYFFNNSFEFFLANFMLLYGIIVSVLLSFLLKKIFTVTTLAQFKDLALTSYALNVYFIRQQNFIHQQNISTGTRIWKKTTKKNDF